MKFGSCDGTDASWNIATGMKINGDQYYTIQDAANNYLNTGIVGGELSKTSAIGINGSWRQV